MRLRPSICFALFAWLCAFIVSTPVHAGTMTLSVQEGGGPLLSIDDNTAFDLNPLVGEINANPVFLNAGLNHYEFTTLGATSNPGIGPTPLLTQTGEVTRTTSGPGASLTVTATNNDFTPPPNPLLNPLVMRSATTDVFSLSGNDFRSFHSYYDPNNVKGNTGAGSTPSPLIFHTTSGGPGPVAQATVTSNGLPGLPPLFALTSQSSIWLGPGAAVGGQHLQFASTTVIIASPEPAGATLIMIGAAATLLVRSSKRRSATSR